MFASVFLNFFSQTCVYLCYQSNKKIKSGLNIIIAFKTEKKIHTVIWLIGLQDIFMNNIFYIYILVKLRK